MVERRNFLDSLLPLKEILLSTTELDEVYERSGQHNAWFIKPFLQEAIDAILAQYLNREKCEKWLSAYAEPGKAGQRVGLVMAGNIPLVGFHDLFCVLASGHQAVIKLSDKDPYLLPYLIRIWSGVYPAIQSVVHFEDKLSSIDAAIATGSTNSGRYFEYYFRNYPHIFRQNRNGVGVLTGDESMEELKSLAKDIFLFFGLGCRNISKLYVPPGYDFSKWQEAIADWAFVGDHNKYKNNLEYNYAIFLINQIPHIPLGHLMLKEDQAIASRIGCLHYSYYQDVQELEAELNQRRNEIQCVVSRTKISSWDHVRPGESQIPALDQYADGVDTMSFLIGLN